MHPRHAAVAFAVAATTLAGAVAPARAGSSKTESTAARYEVPALPKGITLVATTVTVTVKKGDSFSAIAARYGLTAARLASTNELTLRSVLQPGQKLTVPGVLVPNRVPKRLPSDLAGTNERLALVPSFLDAAREFAVPYDLLMSMAYVESGWQRTVVSPVGAVGVGQLMPFTVRFVAGNLLRERGLDVRDAGDNIRMSARYLAYLLQLTRGDQYRALAAYYQGHGAVLRTGVSPGGHTYASLILGARTRFRY